MILNNMETETLARLYLKQGYPDRAVKIFEKLLAEDPMNRLLADALSESRLALVEMHGKLDENASKRLRVLEWMLARLMGISELPEVEVDMEIPIQEVPKASLPERRLVILKAMLERLIQ